MLFPVRRPVLVPVRVPVARPILRPLSRLDEARRHEAMARAAVSL